MTTEREPQESRAPQTDPSDDTSAIKKWLRDFNVGHKKHGETAADRNATMLAENIARIAKERSLEPTQSGQSQESSEVYLAYRRPPELGGDPGILIDKELFDKNMQVDPTQSGQSQE